MTQPIWQMCYTCRDYAFHRRDTLAVPLADKARRESRDVVEVVDEFMMKAHARHTKPAPEGGPLYPGGPTSVLNPAVRRFAAMMSLMKEAE